MAGMAGQQTEWQNRMADDGMAEWQKEWQNGRMVGMATYVLFMVHTDDTNTDSTLISYSIDTVSAFALLLRYPPTTPTIQKSVFLLKTYE